ncbi:MAG: GntR family transcriptional regulator [Clostridia bacterium]|nr:GntR family transcriptional regulator [Clostridia bacterium]
MSPRFAEPERDTSLGAKVFREVEQRIIDGSYAPGESLTEIRLSTELGVSRTPVREALRQLEREGLVHNIPNKGAVVVGISEKDIADIYDIRITLEGLAARLAAENATPEELDSLRQIVELQEYFVSKNDSLQVRQLDSAFHNSLYEACRSRPLRQTLASFSTYTRRVRELSVRTEGRATASVAEHRHIYEAILRKDSEGAEASAKAHILKAKENVMASI